MLSADSGGRKVKCGSTEYVSYVDLVGAPQLLVCISPMGEPHLLMSQHPIYVLANACIRFCHLWLWHRSMFGNGHVHGY